MRVYHQSKFENSLFYRIYSVILTYVDDFEMVSQKQEANTSPDNGYEN